MQSGTFGAPTAVSDLNRQRAMVVCCLVTVAFGIVTDTADLSALNCNAVWVSLWVMRMGCGITWHDKHGMISMAWHDKHGMASRRYGMSHWGVLTGMSYWRVLTFGVGCIIVGCVRRTLVGSPHWLIKVLCAYGTELQ
jgi:hypothetical protein